jgi:hypothetical protein
MPIVQTFAIFLKVGSDIINKKKDGYDESEDKYFGLSDEEIADEEMKKFYKRLAN